MGMLYDVVYCGNALQVLKEMPNNSVDCIITSPPFFSLRRYNTEPQIWGGNASCEHQFVNNFCVHCDAWRGELGQEPLFKHYINHLMMIIDELYRVLKDTGTFFIEIRDSYASHAQSSSRFDGKNYGKHKLSDGTRSGRTTTDEVKRKSLCNIPHRLAIAMTDNGWVHRNTIVWQKPDCLPESVKDRFTLDYSFIQFFVKQRKYYFKQQIQPARYALRIREERLMLNWKYQHYHPRLQNIREQYKHAPADASGDDIVHVMSNMRSVWSIPTSQDNSIHTAPMPESLVERLIDAGCPEHGIVLDPFLGSGTTAVVAKKMQRHYIGIELNPEYCQIAMKRIDQTPVQLQLHIEENTNASPEDDNKELQTLHENNTLLP